METAFESCVFQYAPVTEDLAGEQLMCNMTLSSRGTSTLKKNTEKIPLK